MSRKLSFVVAVLTVLLAFGVAANAAPIVVSGATQQAGGEWLYEYEIQNPAESPGSVYDFYIPILGDPIDVYTPSDWYSFYATGFVEWAADWGYEVSPGTSLSGFGFTSLVGPVTGPMYLTTDDNDYTEFEVTGDVPGVPEPATILLTSFGIIAAGVARFRSKKKRG